MTINYVLSTVCRPLFLYLRSSPVLPLLNTSFRFLVLSHRRIALGSQVTWAILQGMFNKTCPHLLSATCIDRLLSTGKVSLSL